MADGAGGCHAPWPGSLGVTLVGHFCPTSPAAGGWCHTAPAAQQGRTARTSCRKGTLVCVRQDLLASRGPWRTVFGAQTGLSERPIARQGALASRGAYCAALVCGAASRSRDAPRAAPPLSLSSADLVKRQMSPPSLSQLPPNIMRFEIAKASWKDDKRHGRHTPVPLLRKSPEKRASHQRTYINPEEGLTNHREDTIRHKVSRTRAHKRIPYKTRYHYHRYRNKNGAPYGV